MKEKRDKSLTHTRTRTHTQAHTPLTVTMSPHSVVISVSRGVSHDIMAKRQGENWGHCNAMPITTKLSVLGVHVRWEFNIYTVIPLCPEQCWFFEKLLCVFPHLTLIASPWH